jgi:hypothetical protein
VRNNKKKLVSFARESSKDLVPKLRPDRKMGMTNIEREPEWDKNKILQQLSYVKERQRLELFEILEKY